MTRAVNIQQCYAELSIYNNVTRGMLFDPDLAVEEVSHVLGPDFYSGFSSSTSEITDFLILYSNVIDKIYESPIMRLID